MAVIAVTKDGRRFGNEALSYHDFVQNLVKACKGQGEVTCWIVCDHAHLREYGMGAVRMGGGKIVAERAADAPAPGCVRPSADGAGRTSTC